MVESNKDAAAVLAGKLLFLTKSIHCSLQCDLGIIRFICWWSTWLKHLLHQVETNTRFALVLSHSKVIQQVKMSHVGTVGITMLIDQPFPLAGVGVSCADIL